MYLYIVFHLRLAVHLDRKIAPHENYLVILFSLISIGTRAAEHKGCNWGMQID